MREVGPSTDSGRGAPASGEQPASDPPPSSQRGFIGTNTNTAQAYVPPTAVRDTPEPPVPRKKVALADEVDPRKAPTHPAMKKAAQALADEIQSERPPPLTEAASAPEPGDVSRASTNAPPRIKSTPPTAPISREPSKRIPSPRPARHRTPPVDPPETPAQKRAALALTLLFAALLVIAAYFLLRGSPPSPPTPPPGSTAPAAPP